MLHDTLIKYKGTLSSLAGYKQEQLAELLSAFIQYHSKCIAPLGFDIVAVVPSSRSRSGIHPLASTLARVTELEKKLADVLSFGPERITRSTPASRGYCCDRALVKGSKVLIVDDTVTSGAHLQSAVVALKAGGAKEVYPLVIARHVDSHRPATKRALYWTNLVENHWRVDRCIHCVNSNNFADVPHAIGQDGRYLRSSSPHRWKPA